MYAASVSPENKQGVFIQEKCYIIITKIMQNYFIIILLKKVNFKTDLIHANPVV